MNFPRVLLIACALCVGPAQAQEAKSAKSFLELSEGQRRVFLEGAYRTVAHLLSIQDKKKGECAASFWFDDREAKRALIEKTIAANPDRSETTVILGLLTQACGPLAPKTG